MNTTMTLEDVKDQVQRIRASAGDCEVAHGMEDQLRADFIAYVAQAGDQMLRDMAAEIMKTDAIDFPRYCA